MRLKLLARKEANLVNQKTIIGYINNDDQNNKTKKVTIKITNYEKNCKCKLYQLIMTFFFQSPKEKSSSKS